MVERRITDGKRIAQLLASELTGLETGPLSAVEVTDADPDAEPTGEGTFAYAITRAGERVGAVYVHETRARVVLSVDAASLPESVAAELDESEDEPVLWIDSGAAVKHAVDLLVATFDA
ncbi:MAG: hypothetical protein ABEH35_05280 [Haloarculaceae archaeon]